MNIAEKLVVIRQRGMIDDAELVRQLIDCAGYLAPSEIVVAIDEPTLAALKASVAVAPSGDEEWDKWNFPLVAKLPSQTWKEAADLAKSTYRKGIEALRRFFDETLPPDKRCS